MINVKGLFTLIIGYSVVLCYCRSDIRGRRLHSNQNAYKDICSEKNHTYDDVNSQYSTASSYIDRNYGANDNDKYSMEFYLGLISSGEVSDINKFFKGGVIGYIMFIVIAIGVLITWLSFGILWCCNLCLFIKEHNTFKCRLLPYITLSVLFGVGFILLIASVVVSNYAGKDFRRAICSLLKVSFEGVNGKEDQLTIPQWPGTSKVILSLEETKTVIDSFATNYISSFLLFNQIITDAQAFENSITNHETQYGKFEIQSPNADSTKKILPIFLQYYSPITSSDKTLYKIFNEYLTNVKPSVNALIEIENNSKQISLSSTQMKAEIDKTIAELTALEVALNQINEKMMSNLMILYDLFTNVILMLFNISLALMIIITGVFLISSSVFKFKPIRKLKYLLHVLWNINFFFIAISFIVSAFIGILGIISHDIIFTINHMLSPVYLEQQQNSLFDFKLNTVNHIDTCLNSDSDLSKSINVNTVYYDYIDYVYLRTFTLFELNDSISSITQSAIIANENEIYIKYQKNIPITTDSSYGNDDFTSSLYLLNKWTDSGLSDTVQPPCITRSFDHWVANVNQCPYGYIYSPNGINPKNCLLIPNWTKPGITSRYNSACDSTGGVPIIIGARKYFDLLLDYYISCDNLLNTILSGNRDFSNKYESLLKNIKQETKNIKPLLDSLKSVYEPIIGNNTVYQMFNCSLLKTDLLLFYDQMSNKFYTKSLSSVIMTLISLLMAYAGNYFSIDFIYRREDIMVNGERAESEGDSKNNKEEESEGTPEYEDNNNKDMVSKDKENEVRGYFPSRKKNEDEDNFEDNPMFNIMARNEKKTLATDNDRKEEDNKNINQVLKLNQNSNKQVNDNTELQKGNY